MRRLSAFLGSTVALSACANPPPAQVRRAGDQCFWSSQVTGFSDAGANRAVVNIGQRESWELELSPGCPDVNWAMKIGILSHGGERICTGRPAELVVPTATGSGQRCLVRNVRKLSPAEAASARGQKSK